MGRFALPVLASMLFAVGLVHPVFAQIDIPDSARPGAVRPGDVRDGSLPQADTVPVLEVPAVIDRPFDINEGDHVAVKRFNLLNARDMPKYDINIAEVEAALVEIVNNKPEGFTIGQMSEAADRVTAYYREKGLILASTVVPVQSVNDGVVDLEVFEGKLGRVLTEGNEMYKDSVLQRPFDKLIGQPITQAEVENAILTLTDYYGLSIFGIFQPGIQVGSADILLRVQEEKHWAFSPRADNQGTRETGRARVRTTFEWNSPTGAADKLSATFQQTYRPKNNFFQAYDYQRYLGFWGLRAGLSYDRNNFDVGGEFAAQDISAETTNTGGFLEKSFARSRLRNFSTRLSLVRKDSFTFRGTTQLNQDKLAVLSLEAIYDSVDQRFQGLNFATLKVHQGIENTLGSMGSAADAAEIGSSQIPSRRGADGTFAAGEYFKLTGTYTRLQNMSPVNDWFNLENNFFNGHSILFNAELQWTDDMLVPLEQYSVGGADNVRAYGVGERLWDKAVFSSIEYLVNAPFISDEEAFAGRTWGELVQVSAFYDIATGRNLNPLTTGIQGYEVFRGAGVALRFNVPGLVSARLSAAWAMGERESVPTDPVNNRKPQIWGDITFTF
jgi:hemolysin activation/secretion protein